MGKIGLLIVCALFHSQAQACLFAGLELQYDTEGNKTIELSFETTAPFPASLFVAMKDKIDEFEEKYCKDAIRKKTLKVRATGEIFTAFYTAEDECDGGNSDGVIIRGNVPEASYAVAFIKDSYIHCLK